MKETQKQRKEAKLLKQLEKQKREEAAEKERLDQNQNKKGSIIVLSGVSPCEGCSDVMWMSHTGRGYTVSVAVPGSVLDNAQSPELRTYLAGQIARACVVFCVDEIIVFDEDGEDLK